jgi:hypothetical protein
LFDQSAGNKSFANFGVRPNQHDTRDSHYCLHGIRKKRVFVDLVIFFGFSSGTSVSATIHRIANVVALEAL